MATAKKQIFPKKERKISSGPIYDKARTMQKMVDAVGNVLQRHGYPGLSIVNITTVAGVDRRLVSAYFGTIDNLIATYLKQNDYWQSTAQKNIELLLEHSGSLGKAEIVGLLQEQFDMVLKDETLQKIIHWELGEKNKTLRKLANRREAIGEPLLETIEKKFAGPKLDLRAILALQIGGLYYLSLQAKANGSAVCGININNPNGKQRINEALKMVIELAYDKEG